MDAIPAAIQVQLSVRVIASGLTALFGDSRSARRPRDAGPARALMSASRNLPATSTIGCEEMGALDGELCEPLLEADQASGID